MTGLVKFGLKVGILGGSIYYTRQVGVWDDSARTYEIAREVINYSKPYVNSAVDQLQTQYPAVKELPTIADMNRSTAVCWNKSLMKSVDFVVDLPCTLKKYIDQGASYVLNELQKEGSSPESRKSTQNS